MSKKKDNHSDEQNEAAFDQNTGAKDNAASESTQENEASETDESAEDKLTRELQELNEKYLRLYSEFDNYKRRTSKERIELLTTAGKDIIVSLLGVLDDFERAEKSMKDTKDIEAVKEGVKLVHNKLRNILTQKGLKPMESIGQEFDVDFHEAVTKIPAPEDNLKGKVVDELEKGYTLNDKVIRFAKVVIGE